MSRAAQAVAAAVRDMGLTARKWNTRRPRMDNAEDLQLEPDDTTAASQPQDQQKETPMPRKAAGTKPQRSHHKKAAGTKAVRKAAAPKAAKAPKHAPAPSAQKAIRPGKKGLLLVTTKDLPLVHAGLDMMLKSGALSADDAARVSALQARVESRI